MWTFAGPWGAPVGHRYLKKSTFWTLWAPFGRPVGSFGLLWGTFWGRLCVKNRVFLSCDLQAHFLHHFGVLFTAFWEHFGSDLGGVGVQNRPRSVKVVIYANLRISYVKPRFAWVRAMGSGTPQRQKTCLKTVTTTRAYL